MKFIEIPLDNIGSVLTGLKKAAGDDKMECPVPKWFRRRFVKDCKVMQVGLNDQSLKKAALVFIDRHFKFCASYER